MRANLVYELPLRFAYIKLSKIDIDLRFLFLGVLVAFPGTDFSNKKT